MGPPGTWVPTHRPLLGPALVGAEVAIDFRPDGSWISTATTKEKRRLALKMCPPVATRKAIGKCMLKATRPPKKALIWAPPITFARSMKMPIENHQEPIGDPDRYKPITFRATSRFHGKARHDNVKVVVLEDGGVERLFFAKCNGFFRDSNGAHFVALQWFKQVNDDVMEPTVRLPRLQLSQVEAPVSHSIMPATAITNGALVVGVGSSFYAVMHPAEQARYCVNKALR